MQFYINGQRATAEQAVARINARYTAMGGMPLTVEEMQDTARTEEGRDYLNELSDYVVEFIATE